MAKNRGRTKKWIKSLGEDLDISGLSLNLIKNKLYDIIWSM